MQREEKGRPGQAQRGRSETTGQAPSDREPAQVDRGRKQDRETTGQTDEPRSKQGETKRGRSDRQRAQDADRKEGQAGQRGRRDRDRDRAVGQSEPRRGAAERDRAADRDRDRMRGEARDTDRDRTRTRGEARETDRDRRSGQAERQTDRTTTRSGGISMDTQQRTEVTRSFSERIEQRNVRPLRDVRFSVSVGTRVPRNVRVYDVPPDIVRVQPAFRGHKFVLVRDEIVVVEPRSYRIVAVLPRSGAAQATRRTSRETVGRGDARIRLSTEERRMIRERVVRMESCRHELRLDFSIGIPLPRTVEVCDFPAEVVAEVPEIRSYRYMVRGDEVVIVDPDERRIVEVID